MGSVTDPGASASSAPSRNAVIEAELLAAKERSEARNAAHPESAAAVAEIRALLGNDSDENEPWPTKWQRRQSAYSCETCDHVFAEGDVVYRRREHEYEEIGWRPPTSVGWRLTSSCLGCVSRWHTSWLAAAKCWHPPVECAGGCGVLVTSPYLDGQPTTCSERCSKNAARAKRLVLHDERECVECEQPFTPTRKDAEYCSTACRMKAYRRRRKAER